MGGGLLALIAGIAILLGVDNELARAIGAAILVGGIVAVIGSLAVIGRQS